MMAKYEADNNTEHPEYKSVITLLLYRHFCRLYPWPESIDWCFKNIGVDVFSKMFGPYFFQCSGSLRNWTQMENLEKISTRVLLIHGEHDYIVPDLASMARDRLPNASLVLFHGCSHTPFFENPKLYMDTLKQFLKC